MQLINKEIIMRKKEKLIKEVLDKGYVAYCIPMNLWGAGAKEVEVYALPRKDENDYIEALAFAGKAEKPAWYYKFKNKEVLDYYIAELVKKREAMIEEKELAKKEKEEELAEENAMAEKFDVDDLIKIKQEAKAAAEKAAEDYWYNELDGEDKYSCGFAWVEIYGINGNSKLGRKMKKAGFSKNYNGAYEVWNPSGIGAQNIDVKEKGADAYANVFKEYGFKAYACSRLD
jgi:hypothetical protein